jgi:choline kinase
MIKSHIFMRGRFAQEIYFKEKNILQIEMALVLITTSGTGSRLGNRTKYMNKALVKVGDKFAICYIIEKYEQDTTFVVTLGYLGQQVADFLNLAYPERKFIFVWVDKYEGEGSSLVYSMRKAKDFLNGPFYFHCCDTLLDAPLETPRENTVWVIDSIDKNTYAGIQGFEDNVVSINRKGSSLNNYDYIGISYIHTWQSFWSSLENIFTQESNNMNLSDIDVMRQMLASENTFRFIKRSDFYDTGNPASFQKAQKHYKAEYDVLEKDYESLCFLADKVIKFINDKEINKKRGIRGRDLCQSAPKILGLTDNFLAMELVKGEVLSEVKSYGEVVKLLKWAEKNLWTMPERNEIYRQNCINFYKYKTVSRLKSLTFLENESFSVNDVKTGTIQELLERVDFSELTTDTFYRFHGDFILDNILKKPDGSYCLLDWRHEFDGQLYKGDMYYDLAKLRHNIIFNHKNILNGLYSVDVSGANVFVDLKCNYFLLRQLEEFDGYLKERRLNDKKVRILNAIIWLNMSPLYDGNLSRFLFYFGKLNLFLEITKAETFLES